MADLFFVMPKEEMIQTLRDEIRNEFRRIEDERKKRDGMRRYTINKFAKLSRRSFTTIKNMVNAGTIKTGLDGLIPESELDRLLEGK